MQGFHNQKFLTFIQVVSKGLIHFKSIIKNAKVNIFVKECCNQALKQYVVEEIRKQQSTFIVNSSFVIHSLFYGCEMKQFSLLKLDVILKYDYLFFLLYTIL